MILIQIIVWGTIISALFHNQKKAKGEKEELIMKHFGQHCSHHNFLEAAVLVVGFLEVAAVVLAAAALAVLEAGVLEAGEHQEVGNNVLEEKNA